MRCPECGSKDVQEIDRSFEYSEDCEAFVRDSRMICWNCKHDWHEEEIEEEIEEEFEEE